MAIPTGDAVHGLIVVVVLLGFVAVAAMWVYSDARTHADDGRPIEASVGSLELKTPTAWCLACLVLPELVLPVYVESRTPA